MRESNSCTRGEAVQTHVHEVLGSVRIAGPQDRLHNHRFASVTSEIVLVPGGHIHRVSARTDFTEAHYHLICVETGLQVGVGMGLNTRHVHFIDNETEISIGHIHEFIAATLIDSPVSD